MHLIGMKMKKLIYAFLFTFFAVSPVFSAYDPECEKEMKAWSLSPTLCKGGVTKDCLDKLIRYGDLSTRARMCQYVDMECLDYTRDRGVDYKEGVRLCKHFDGEMDCVRRSTLSLREAIKHCNSLADENE